MVIVLQVDTFISMMDEAKAILSVEIDPESLFNNAYAVKNHFDIYDMVFEFKPGKIDAKKLEESFACEGSMDTYLLSKYLPEEEYNVKNYTQEKIDAMGWEEKQKEVDEIEKKYEAGEISIFDVYKKFGWADDESLNEEKVNGLLDKVMELCKGQDLLTRIKGNNGKLNEKKVAFSIMKVLHAISYCHEKGVTHRDLKPENILFETNDPDSEIKLIDFGLSRTYQVNEKMHTILGR